MHDGFGVFRVTRRAYYLQTHIELSTIFHYDVRSNYVEWRCYYALLRDRRVAYHLTREHLIMIPRYFYVLTVLYDDFVH